MQLDWCLMRHTEQTRKPVGAAILRPEKTEAIIAAFFAELGSSGYEGLTMDRVAERAGVGKAALYRRWPSKTRDAHRSGGSIRNKGCPSGGHREPAGRHLVAIADDAIAVLAKPSFAA